MSNQAKPKLMRTVFHADLSDGHDGEEYWVQVCGKRYSLVAHTDASRQQARNDAPHLAAISDKYLTHYTAETIEMPADEVIRVHLKHSLKTFPDAQGQDGVSHVAIHVPPPPHKLAELAETGTPHHQPIDYGTTARALIFHHPDLINKDPEVSNNIMEHVNSAQISAEFDLLAQKMRQMGPPTENSGWARLVPYTPPKNDETGIDGKTRYFHQPTQDIIDAAGPVGTLMMKATKNDLELKDKKWQQATGISVQSSDGQHQLTLAARIEATNGDNWRATLTNLEPVHGLGAHIEIVDAAKKQIKITLSNTYIRYLGAYIRFYDASGSVIKVSDWKTDDNTIATIMTEVLDIQYDDLRFIGHIQPVNNVFAIPIIADPGKLEVTVTFPSNAVSACIYGSGLGTGEDAYPKTPIVGGVMTGVFNLGVPALMLAFATAAQSYKPLYDIVDNLSKNKVFLSAVIGAGTAFFGAQFGIGAAHKEMDWHAFSKLAQILFDKAATKALVWIEGNIAGEEVADEIPFAGWIMVAINITTGIAQMAETIVEVVTSPWNIENQISTAITTSVTLYPDPRHSAFPQPPSGTKASYTVKMIYKDQTRPTVSQLHEVSAGSTAKTLPATFPNNTLGGQVKFEADYYLGDWLAGKATTGWMNNDEAHVQQVDLYLVQYPIPLSETSIYKHTALLTYQNGAYIWQPTATAPTGTIQQRNASNTGNAISEWMGLSLSQKQGMLGFAWKAAGMGIVSCVSGQDGQLYALQNINIPGTPMTAVKFPSCGFDGPSQLIYDPYPPKFSMKDGQWELGADGKPLPDPTDLQLGNYYIDPRKANISLTKDGGYHLRKVTLDDKTPFDMGDNLMSWGRFTYFPDSLALHPAGHVIGVSAQCNKIQIAQIPLQGMPDGDLPVARIYAGEALNPDRKGLLFRPVAVTCAYDGTILILEDTKSAGNPANSQILARIQAFDLAGNPVDRFVDAAGKPSPFLPLSDAANYNYLDIASVGSEKMTYIYVLYYTGDGKTPSDYNMAIYQYGTQAPTKNPLVTTNSIAAAKLAVDMWHTVYTLNYDMVTDGKGQHAGPKNTNTGPAGRTVPSVSEWLPPLPS